jgi:WD40 repeat protein
VDSLNNDLLWLRIILLIAIPLMPVAICYGLNAAGYTIDATPDESNRYVAWNHDGTQLAVSGNRGLYIYSSDLTEQAHNEDLHDSIAWSRDLTLTKWNEVITLDPATLDKIETLSATDALSSDSSINTIQLSPNGNQLAILDMADTLTFFSVEGGTLQPADMTLSDVNWMVWSPDSTLIAAGTSDTDLTVLAATSGETRQTFTSDNTYTTVAWNTDSSQIAAMSNTSVDLWDVSSGDQILSLDAPSAVSLDWNGDHLATTDRDTIQIWDVNSGESALTIEPDSGTIRAIAWNPSGDQIAAVGMKDSAPFVWIFDAQSGELIADTSED